MKAMAKVIASRVTTFMATLGPSYGLTGAMIV